LNKQHLSARLFGAADELHLISQEELQSLLKEAAHAAARNEGCLGTSIGVRVSTIASQQGVGASDVLDAVCRFLDDLENIGLAPSTVLLAEPTE